MTKSSPKIERIGTLTVPFPQWKFSQLLMWLRTGTYKDGLPPVDLSILPDQPPQLSSYEDGLTFYMFREIETIRTEDMAEIVFVYDRVRVDIDSTGVKLTETSTTLPEVGESDAFGLARKAATILSVNYGVVFSEDLLRRLLYENAVLQSSKTPEEFVKRLVENLGLLSSEGFASQIQTEIHLGPDE